MPSSSSHTSTLGGSCYCKDAVYVGVYSAKAASLPGTGLSPFMLIATTCDLRIDRLAMNLTALRFQLALDGYISRGSVGG